MDFTVVTKHLTPKLDTPKHPPSGTALTSRYIWQVQLPLLFIPITWVSLLDNDTPTLPSPGRFFLSHLLSLPSLNLYLYFSLPFSNSHSNPPSSPAFSKAHLWPSCFSSLKAWETLPPFKRLSIQPLSTSLCILVHLFLCLPSSKCLESRAAWVTEILISYSLWRQMTSLTHCLEDKCPWPGFSTVETSG